MHQPDVMCHVRPERMLHVMSGIHCTAYPLKSCGDRLQEMGGVRDSGALRKASLRTSTASGWAISTIA